LIAYRRARLAHAIATAIAVFWLDGSFDAVQRDVSMQVHRLETTIARPRRASTVLPASPPC
jgi:hypothetical protein